MKREEEVMEEQTGSGGAVDRKPSRSSSECGAFYFISFFLRMSPGSCVGRRVVSCRAGTGPPQLPLHGTRRCIPLSTNGMQQLCGGAARGLAETPLPDPPSPSLHTPHLRAGERRAGAPERRLGSEGGRQIHSAFREREGGRREGVGDRQC